MPDSVLTWLLGIALVLYVLVMFLVSYWCSGKIHNVRDYLVASRALPLSLAWATLLATWFGAGTILTQADEVEAGGLQRAALDPFGAGLCLILAGMFFAGPLWRMDLLTLSDFFKQKYGQTTEVLSAIIMVPSYFGWIAAQLVALAGVLQMLFSLDSNLGIVLIAGIGMGYTLMGGMWSVTLTDAIQICLVILGLIVLVLVTLTHLGDGSVSEGMVTLLEQTEPAMLQPIPTENLTAIWAWIGVLCVGALGNIPGQDLMQRVFAAKSDRVARQACFLAGGMYILLGLLPLMLGLAGRLIPGVNPDDSVVLSLAVMLLKSPVVLIVFLLALVSAVLSTIDSAILSPACVLGWNLFPKINRLGGIGQLTLVKLAVVLVTLASVLLAYVGESAYTLLEGAYELPLVGLFVPLALGLLLKPRGQGPAVLAIVVGTALWLGHAVVSQLDSNFAGFLGSEVVPIPLACMLCGLIAYLITHIFIYKKSR